MMSDLGEFVPALAADVSISAVDDQFGFTEVTDDNWFLVSLLDLSQDISVHGEGGSNLTAIQSLLLWFDSKLEVNDGGFEGWHGVEGEFISVLFQMHSWGDGVSHFTENHANAYERKEKEIVRMSFVAQIHWTLLN